MLFRVAAGLVVLVHAAFILYVVFGGLLVFKDRRWCFVHLPAVAWGAIVEARGWICPLTPIENRLRIIGGLQPYGGDCIGHYLLPVIYPAGLTRHTQFVLALIVLAANLIIYGYYLFRSHEDGHS
jgi:hypothetical protein